MFRADLYYRLKVAVITVPPLRERKAEILPLAQGFWPTIPENTAKMRGFQGSQQKIFYRSITGPVMCVSLKILCRGWL